MSLKLSFAADLALSAHFVHGRQLAERHGTSYLAHDHAELCLSMREHGQVHNAREGESTKGGAEDSRRPQLDAMVRMVRTLLRLPFHILDVDRDHANLSLARRQGGRLYLLQLPATARVHVGVQRGHDFLLLSN